MPSLSSSIYDVAGALKVAESNGFLGAERIWKAINQSQSDFLRLMALVWPYVDQLVAEGNMAMKVSWDASDVNDFFAARNLDIHLTDQGSPDFFYVGAIFEQLVKWLVPGELWGLEGANGRSYPYAVKMEEGVEFVLSHMLTEPIARIPTENSDDVRQPTSRAIWPTAMGA